MLAVLATVVVAGTEVAIPALLPPLVDKGFTGGTLPLWAVPVAIVGVFFIRGVAQFIKGRSDTGEEGFFRKFPEQVRWHVCGEGFTWETQDNSRDTLAAQAAWKIAQGYLGDPSINLVVFDEMTYAFKYGWLELDAVLTVLQARPAQQHVIITGRAAPQPLMDAADTVTDMGLVKHAFKDGVAAMPGMEF